MSVLTSAPAIFLFETKVRTVDGEVFDGGTDSTWHGIATNFLASDGWQFCGTDEPLGIHDADFNTADWPQCIEVSAPAGGHHVAPSFRQAWKSDILAPL